MSAPVIAAVLASTLSAIAPPEHRTPSPEQLYSSRATSEKERAEHRKKLRDTEAAQSRKLERLKGSR